eukprot:2135471-Prymnesium_polylepis.2
MLRGARSPSSMQRESWCSVPQLLAFALMLTMFAAYSFMARVPLAAPTCKQDGEQNNHSVLRTAPFDNARGLLRESSCSFTCRPFVTLERPWAAWYSNNTAYDAYSGIDLIPEAGGSLPLGSPFKLSKEASRSPLGGGRLDVCECTTKVSHGKWFTQRVGPLLSTGGYDWWQFSWDNFANLREELEFGDVFEMDAHILTPTDAAGNILGHPPIHIHHVHVVHGLGASFASSLLELTARVGGADSFIEHHGDWQFPPTDAGVDSLGEDYGSYGKLFTRPFSTNLELNDVRPSNSSPLTWYFQMSIRVRPAQDNSCSPSSLHTFSGPGDYCSTGQSCTVATLHVSGQYESFSYYTSRMPHDGHLVRVKFHGHAYIFRHALLFRAAPQQLGLAELGWRGERPWKAIPTALFGSNANLKKHLVAKARDGGGNMSVICEVEARTERISNAVVDRAPD